MAQDNKKRWAKRFDSLTAFHEYLENGKTQSFFDYPRSHEESDWRTKQTGTATYKQADELFLFGDKELAEKIESAGVADMRMKLSRQKPQRIIRSSVVGFAPNVPAYVAGTPNSMFSVKKINVPQQVIKVAYSLSIDWTVDAQEIIDVSAKFISACMLVESNGVRLDVDVVWPVKAKIKSKKYDTICACVKIKDSGTSFDVLKMSYPLAHSSMLRRHIFRFAEVSPEAKGYQKQYGYIINDVDEIKRAMDVYGKNVDSVLSFYDIRFKSVEDIAKIIGGGK